GGAGLGRNDGRGRIRQEWREGRDRQDGRERTASYPSVSCAIWYCSSFLYKLLRGVPMTSAVFEMFHPFSRSLSTRNARSAFSLNSRSVPAFAPSASVCTFDMAGPLAAADGLLTMSGRSGTSIVSPAVMMII